MISVFKAQSPLRAKYRQSPESAIVTDHARTSGPDPADPFHSVVEPMDGCGVAVPVGVHAAVGGPHDAPTPGDLLCAALAACQDSAVRMVANILGVVLTHLEVRVTAQADARGALGMGPDIAVGFSSITCDVEFAVEDGTPQDLIEKLRVAAERCCVVQQTLKNPPAVKTAFKLNGRVIGD